MSATKSAHCLMIKVEVQTNARLHFGLVDLSGATRRVDGGLGLSIRDPSIRVTVEPSRSLEIQSPPELVAICSRVIQAVSPWIGNPRVKITIQTEISTHSGFGSGTQIALAVGSALLHFFNRSDVSVEQLAVASRRGGTSGVGVYTFQKGGLIVDGGRAWPTQKNIMGPSAAFAFADIPPCTVRLPFPDWGLCVLVPNGGPRRHDQDEWNTFRALTPLPLSEVNVASRLILTGILPTVATSDFQGFCESVEELRQVGMKKREWELLAEAAVYCERLLKECGFKGISTSSWGPAIFGFAPSIETASEMGRSLCSSGSLQYVSITKASNHGYRLSKIPL
jgi:beta-ribofuranosylaminobenzene 5'-phosphate synthase